MLHAEAIKAIRFGLFSPEQIKRMSVAKITVPEVYNEDGYPIEGGLLDQRLGVIDPGLVCKTCGAKAKTCPGHFGHIELVRPVIHPEFGKFIYLLLQATCSSCHRWLLDANEIKEFKELIHKELTREETINDVNITNALSNKVKYIKKCPHCGAVQKKIKFTAPTEFYIENTPLKPNEIKDWLAAIPDDDLKILGIDPNVTRPEWAILTVLLVPPVNVRPSITLETGERSEDDLTHKLVDIIRTNQRLEQYINAGAAQLIIDDQEALLQYHITTYFNNETAGLPAARQKTGRALKTLAQRLKGKEGIFRYNLIGKRVNFSARTVISVDPYINIDEVGVPREVAERLTLPFYVTEWNIDKAREWVSRKEYPMALDIIVNGQRKRILDTNRDEVLKELKPGDIIERQLVDGDFVLFNRQPSLHRISMMAHRVRVLPGRTFRVNDITTLPYNADFDGDEMNLHVPQSLEAIAEAKYLMHEAKQIFSPRDGRPIIALFEDQIGSAYILSLPTTKLKKEEAEYLLGLSGVYELPDEVDGAYLGRDIFSLLFPKDFTFETDDIKIRKGRLIEGKLTKKTLENIYKALGAKYGFEVLQDFLFKAGKLTTAFLTLYGITVGVNDYMLDEKKEKAREEIISEALTKAKELYEKYKAQELQPLPGSTLKETYEKMLISILVDARSKAENFIKSNYDISNHAYLMAISGGRGSEVNLSQISFFLGQQLTLSGTRLKRGYYSKRILPFTEPFNTSDIIDKGFVTTNFYRGLSLRDMFSHAAGSRDSEIEKSLVTARSGYMNRRLNNALQDYYVYPDLSVRDHDNFLIETIYGGDGIDPTKVELLKYIKKE